MKCPACKNVLQEMTVDNVTVDICKGGCGGIWFDNFR
jgi:Zn-finger nucleic acid-binding protein